MIRFSRSLVFAAILLAVGARAADTNSPQTVLTLTDVVRHLGERNPRILVEREAIASARADRKTAGAFPNPKLGLNHQEPTGQQTLFTGERQEQVSLEFPLLIPGQRSSRVAQADAAISAAEARVKANTLNITADACASFMRLLSLQQKTEVLSNALAEATHLREVISGRAQNGAATAYDLARVEVETGSLSGRYDAARAELASEAGQLATLLALTNGLPVAQGALQPWEISDRDLFDPTSQTIQSPAVLAASREAAAASAGIKAAQRNRWPEVSVEGGRAWTRHPYGAADFVGLNLELPIFDTRRGQLDKATSDARAAENRRVVAVAETEATIRQLAETIARRKATLERYHADIEPRLARLKEMSSDAYLMGKHTILELLDAEQARRDVMLEEIETLSALVEAQVRFLAITGRLESYVKAQ